MPRASSTVGDRQLTVGDLAVLQRWPAGRGAVAGPDGAKVMLLGGATMDGPRHIWWNFVSSNKERIEKAKEDWREGRFAKVAGRSGVHPAAGEDLCCSPLQFPRRSPLRRLRACDWGEEDPELYLFSRRSRTP